jgi:ribosomal protein L37E
MDACTYSDIEAKYSQCGDDGSGKKMRNVEYSWIQPKICNDKDAQSVQLLESGKIKCRKCGRGEFSEAETENCKYCPDGTY